MFTAPIYDGDNFTNSDGVTFTVQIVPDDTQETPWDREDGHGPVSEWRNHGYNGYASKEPGERPLCRDRNATRFYNMAEAVRIARRDGWSTAPFDTVETPGQRAARAAEADYQRLRAWCDDEWYYVGVMVMATDDNGEEIGSASLWGIESDASEYLAEVANELVSEINA